MRRRLLVLNISATPSCRMLGLRVLPRSQGRVNFNWIDGTSKDVDNCPAKWWILRTYGVVASHTQKPSLITTPFPTQQVFRCGVQYLRRRDSHYSQSEFGRNPLTSHGQATVKHRREGLPSASVGATSLAYCPCL